MGGYDLWVTGAAGRDFATVMYGTSGGFQRWGSISHSPGGSGARQAAPGFRNTVYITGGAGDEFATFGYRARDGSRRWLRTFPGAGIALAVNPVTGNVIVAGTSSRSASGNYTTIAYNGWGCPRRTRCRAQ